MVARARTLQASLLPHGWLDAARQVSLFGLAYLGYRLVRGWADGSANAAFVHARDLISLEHWDARLLLFSGHPKKPSVSRTE